MESNEEEALRVAMEKPPAKRLFRKRSCDEVRQRIDGFELKLLQQQQVTVTEVIAETAHLAQSMVKLVRIGHLTY